jgi:signal transduction histidine kinase
VTIAYMSAAEAVLERVGIAVGLAAVALAAVLAARADAARPQATIWFTTLDVVTGLMFVAGALASTGSVKQRWLMAMVGAAWLVGSIALALSLLHQAVLLVALTAFPSGSLRRWPVSVSAVVAFTIALGIWPQIGIAAVFAVLAAVVGIHRSRDPVTRIFPTVTLSAVSIALTLAWVATRSRSAEISSQLMLVAYLGLQLVIAAAFPLVTRALARRRRRLADEALGAPQPGGLAGLAHVLQETLAEPDLAVHAWRPALGSYVDLNGNQVNAPAAGRRWLEVTERGDRLGAVEYRESELTDPPTQAAVAAAVRLVTRNEQLQNQQQRELAELEASRVRLLQAADRARQRIAVELRGDVERPLTAALATVGDLRTDTVDPEVTAALEVAHAEMSAAQSDISAIVSGVPFVELGDGALRLALDRLAEQCSVPVHLDSSGDVAADREVETTLFYVCSEALTNVVKHAEASAVTVTLERRPSALDLAVVDDGVGGADPSGAGLRGLSDRLASVGGWLQVRSTPGAGTRIEAWVPWRG